MSSWIWAIVVLAVIALIGRIYYAGKQSERVRRSRQEIEEWSGVMDVKREVKSDLSDPDKRKRVRERYNKTK